MALGAFAHQDLPFEKLVEELHPERALAMTPLFQVMLAYQNAPLPRIELPRLTLSGLPVGTSSAMFDLTLTVAEIGAGPETGGFLLTLEHARSLFDATTAERMPGPPARSPARACEARAGRGGAARPPPPGARAFPFRRDRRGADARPSGPFPGAGARRS